MAQDGGGGASDGAFPFVVEFDMPTDGLARTLGNIAAFHRVRQIPIMSEPVTRADGSECALFKFTDLRSAAAFYTAFGGVLLDPSGR